MIKKFSNPLLILWCSLPGFYLNAQDNYARHQLFAGYGFGYTNQVFGELGKTFNVDFLQSVFSDSSNEGKVMPLYLGYRYLLRKHLGLGCNLSYPLMTMEDNSVTIQSKLSDSQRFSALIFLPRVDVIYVNKKIFSLYSGVGIGLIIENKDEVEAQQANIAPAYHITAIGFSIGKTVGLFSEIGYGVNGVLSIGIVTKFGGEDSAASGASKTKDTEKQINSQPCIRL